MARNQSINPKRGEIYVVNFDPSVGSEIQKTRPALILQNDTSNIYGQTTIVAAITSKFDQKLYPTEVLIIAKEGGNLKGIISISDNEAIAAVFVITTTTTTVIVAATGLRSKIKKQLLQREPKNFLHIF